VLSKNTFWDRVRESYINAEDPSYNNVDCDKNHPNAFDDINPSHIVQHTATKQAHKDLEGNEWLLEENSCQIEHLGTT
jgi:hypothetical protein